LSTNVPDCGEIEERQQEWLTSELASAPTDKALILALYHPIYGSIQVNSGSQALEARIRAAIGVSRTPDLFISGHYHCYQHLFKEDGPTRGHHVIAGTGGKPSLLYPMTHAGHTIQDGARDPINHVQMTFSIKSHGYVRITVTRETLKGEFFAVRDQHDRCQPYDSFTVPLRNH
jgi:3',5'-cyclic AMP phosphodiesterase CpdA